MKRATAMLLTLLVVCACVCGCTSATDSDDPLTLNLNDPSSLSARGVSLKDNVLRLERGGLFTLSGSMVGGLEIDCAQEVVLQLNGVDIQNPKGAAIEVVDAKQLTITLMPGTTNTLADGKKHNDDSVEAALNSAAPLVIQGEGTLDLFGNKRHGLLSKKAVLLSGGTLNVTSNNDCLHVAGSLTISGGTHKIKSGKDGLDGEKEVAIEGGTITIDAQDKGVTCKGDFTLRGGDLRITNGTEGVQSKTSATLFGGTLTADTSDDALNATNNITIKGGTHVLRGGGDGLDSNGTLFIEGGTTIAISFGATHGGMDCDENEFRVTGGTFIAVGARNSQPSATSTQPILSLPSAPLTNLALLQGDQALLVFHSPLPQGAVLLSCSELKLSQPYALLRGVTLPDPLPTNLGGLLPAGTTFTRTAGTTEKKVTLSTMLTQLP